MQTGISFTELINHLSSCLGWKIDGDFKTYFRFWFYENFFNADIFMRIRNGTDAAAINVVQNLSGYDNNRYCMTAAAYEFLLDYEKLTQAKKDAKRAHNLSIWAIGISIALGIVQIIISMK